MSLFHDNLLTNNWVNKKTHFLSKMPLQTKANYASILYSVSASENVDGLFRYFLKKVKKMTKSLLKGAKMRLFFSICDFELNIRGKTTNLHKIGRNRGLRVNTAD